MKITEQALLDNGWEMWSMADSNGNRKRWMEKHILDGLILEVEMCEAMPVTLFIVGNDSDLLLPHVTTMEHLAQLEYLLSPYTVMDTAPLDAAIRAQFGDGGEA